MVLFNSDVYNMDIDPQYDNAACDGIEHSFSALSLALNNNLPDELNDAIFDLLSKNYPKELEGVTKIRKLLSREDSPPISEVITSHIAESLLEMTHSRPKEFAFEVCWVLCNIGSGNSSSTRYLIEIKSLEFFSSIFYLDPQSFDLRDQICWAVGNIAGESVIYRDLVIQSEICGKILEYSTILPFTEVSKYQNLVWVLSNFVRGKPHVSRDLSKILEKFFINAISQSNNNGLLVDSCWGLTYCSDDLEDFSQYTVNVLQKLISLTLKELKIAIPAFRVLGNMISNTSRSWELLEPLGILDVLLQLIEHQKPSIKKEALWICSNLCAESDQAVMAFFKANLYQKMLLIVENQNQTVISEVIWTISNTVNTCANEFAKFLVDIGWLDKLIGLFTNVEPKIKCVILEGLSCFAEKCKDGINEQHISKIQRMQENNLDDRSRMLLEKLMDLIA